MAHNVSLGITPTRMVAVGARFDQHGEPFDLAALGVGPLGSNGWDMVYLETADGDTVYLADEVGSDLHAISLKTSMAYGRPTVRAVQPRIVLVGSAAPLAPAIRGHEMALAPIRAITGLPRNFYHTEAEADRITDGAQSDVMAQFDVAMTHLIGRDWRNWAADRISRAVHPRPVVHEPAPAPVVRRPVVDRDVE